MVTSFFTLNFISALHKQFLIQFVLICFYEFPYKCRQFRGSKQVLVAVLTRCIEPTKFNRAP